ncbi:hypothetical protein IKF23_03300 [Candidatus Saccharibacteria bacterium]|nr:hypothetical protein [Candidatus Saccharibacteria bacterium]
MEMSVYRENPAIVLSYHGSGNRNGQYPVDYDLDVFYEDIKEAEVGHTFAPEGSISCHDSERTESLKVIFKDSYGAACLLRTHYESYDWEEAPEDEVELLWFECH